MDKLPVDLLRLVDFDQDYQFGKEVE